MRRGLLLLAFTLCLSRSIGAHEVRPGYLELREVSPGRYEVLWKHPTGGETRITLTPVFPAECTDAGAG